MFFYIKIILFLLFIKKIFSSKEARILNGENIEENEAKYIVRLSIYYGSSIFICTGSLISSKVIITAAHCVVKNKKDSHDRILATKIIVGYGSHQLHNITEINAKQWIIHPKYIKIIKGLAYFDLAIITLSDAILKSNNVDYVKLDFSDVSIKSYKTSYGWGRVGSFKKYYYTNNTQKLSNQLISYIEENSLFIKILDACAWKGDSGGPIIDQVTDKLIAIASQVQSKCSCQGFAIPASNGYMIYESIQPAKEWILSFINS